MRRSKSEHAPATLRGLTRWAVLGLCAAACATYVSPEQLDPSVLEDEPGSTSGSAGKPTNGGAPVSASGASTSSGAATGGVSSTPSGGSAGSSSGGISGSGGTMTSSAGTAGASVSMGGEGGASDPVSDACPNDPAKTAPGVCGCGFPDADTAKLASCKGLKSALVHRYDFEGSGTTVSDRVGTAHGVLKGGATLSAVDGKGAVVLGGGTMGPYVDLPNGLVSALTNATLEAWVTWAGGNAWQRIFDFGDSTNATPEDNPANGKSYLFLTPMTDAASGGVMRAVYSLTGGAAAAETRLEGVEPMPQALTQVALVVDSDNDLLVLYVDGAKASEQAFTGVLSSINDVNAWLGRSQYNADPELTGTLHDFRIYNAALTPLQIATSFAGGTDPAFLAK
jgi:hypothetical protein